MSAWYEDAAMQAMRGAARRMRLACIDALPLRHELLPNSRADLLYKYAAAAAGEDGLFDFETHMIGVVYFSRDIRKIF